MIHVERSNEPGTWICCVPCYWLRRSKAVHKALLTFAMLLVTSLLVTSPVLFLITTLPEGEQPRECAPLDELCLRERDGQDGVCESKACQEASRRMLSSMQRGVDPCKDFYQFACGGFRNPQPYQPTSSFVSLQAQVDDQIKRMLRNETGRIVGAFTKLGQFYNSCLEFKERSVDFSPVYRLLNELGGYIPPESSVSSDITPLISSLLKINGAPLFDLYVDTDIYDQSRTAVFLDLPSKYQADPVFSDMQEDTPRWRRGLSLGITRRKRSNIAESTAYTLIKNNKEEQRSKRIQKIIQGLIPSDMESRERSSEADQLLQFCLALSKIYPRHKDIYNWVDVDHIIYVPYNFTYLQESFGYIRWEMLLNATMNDAATNSYNYDHHSKFRNHVQPAYIYVTAPYYFRSLGKLLNRFPQRIIHNGILVLYATDTLHDIVNVNASENWNDACVKLTKTVFGEALGALYVRQYSPGFLNILTNRVKGLLERIKETLAERMLVMPWLDEETRTRAVFRLRALRGKFEVWRGFQNENLFIEEMVNVTIHPDDFFATIIGRFKQIRTMAGQLRRNSTQNAIRRYHPYAVKAYYEAASNSIVIPLAMMSAWSWGWDGGPTYAVYGTLGSVISHEVLHAFDLHRRRLPLDPDPSNEQWSWITPQAWLRLEVMIECIAKLYARSFWRKVKFFGNSVDVQFDWNVTRNENVADIGALQISYQTWHILTNGRDRTLPGLEALRPSQLFFISAAQTYCTNMTAEAYILSVELDYHTPQPERVNGIIMNSPEFAEAFRCSAGTKMNPPKKCKTW